jgi:hypothetical protein
MKRHDKRSSDSINFADGLGVLDIQRRFFVTLIMTHLRTTNQANKCLDIQIDI